MSSSEGVSREDVDDRMWQLGTSGAVGSLPSAVKNCVAYPSAERLKANSVWANSVGVTQGSFRPGHEEYSPLVKCNHQREQGACRLGILKLGYGQDHVLLCSVKVVVGVHACLVWVAFRAENVHSSLVHPREPISRSDAHTSFGY